MTDTKPRTELDRAPERDALDIPNERAQQQLANVQTVGGVDLLTLGKAFAASGYFPDARSQAQAVTKILAGAELGIPPVAAMQGFHCIPRRKQVNGQWVEQIELSMSANLRAAVIQRDRRIDLRIVEHTNEVCEIQVAVLFAGKWENRGSVRFTIEDARRAKTAAGGGETKPLADGPMWKSYPADMLYAAVMRRISKRYAPHLFIGDKPSSDDEDLVAVEQEVALAAGEDVQALEAPRSEYWDSPAGEASIGRDLRSQASPEKASPESREVPQAADETGQEQQSGLHQPPAPPVVADTLEQARADLDALIACGVDRKRVEEQSRLLFGDGTLDFLDVAQLRELIAALTPAPAQGRLTR